MSESITRLGLVGTLTRLWLLRRLPGPLPAVSEPALVGIAALSLALWIALDRSVAGEGAEFVAYGLMNVGWYVLLALWIAWAISRRSEPRIPIRSAVFVTVALAPVLAFAGALAEWLVSDELIVYAYALIALYVVVYLARAARSITGKSQIPAAVVVALMLIAVGWFNNRNGIEPTVWYPAESVDEEPAADPLWNRGDALLFDQPARIDAVLARIKTNAPDALALSAEDASKSALKHLGAQHAQAVAATRPQVFFVGFAGVGEQRVFAEEIKLAAYNVGRRYGSEERSVLLLNDRRDVDRQPLATVSGLGYALKGIAAMMNIDRDVLFLALSSHGSADPALSVSIGSLPLRDLTGEALASALKLSGIKWKVIVISACHAGAFIKPLRDEHTVILTAAAADRTSFGCSDDRDLTYFGEAFYRDAIPTTTTLREAFAQTTRNIAVREKDEGVKASKPQAFFGAAMDQKLSEIERASASVASASSKD